MFFIIGLGNPGLKYAATRHNAGFEVVERIGYDHVIKLDKKKHQAIIGHGVIAGEKVVLVKPQTYMNLSGESVRDLLTFYKETPDSIIVIYDDTSISLGSLRIRSQGSHGGHNGIKDIIRCLGTDVFKRIRIGVGEKPPHYDLADYVLSRFEPSEIPVIKETIERASQAVDEIIKNGELEAMNKYNRTL